MTINLDYNPATLADLDVITDLEARSYTSDEAATKENICLRIKNSQKAPHPELLFLVARQASTVVGFLCTTLADTDLVTEESMSQHAPSGKTVCLHSVCVSPEHRHQGIATSLLKHWINMHRTARLYRRIALLSRPTLVSFYCAVGFQKIGLSPIVHGPEPWIDCILDI
ncbi:acyl-CoA N-acyltransferase [Absidia repens]|uniref:Acyl-CoA N-acyltransferase n=1 Tax=Absidia repens TaxID=90262 RepID=A0A1X2IGL9_9FUNG|nr:acyl-CoA N-acyltransferase [Absidia repens]